MSSVVVFLSIPMFVVSALQEVKVRSMEDAILHCQGPTSENITLLEWSRPELQSGGYVFFYRNNRPYENYQHDFFKGRVDLRDPSMREGDVSVIVRNVSIRDTGTYKCLITTSSIRGEKRVVTVFNHGINLTVTDSDHTEVKVRPGQDATLQCRGARAAEITLLEWFRPELKSSGYVFFYRNNRPYENYQHDFFKGRVELRDPSMKDGDVSVIVRNVSASDTGTFECLITTSTVRGGERVISEVKDSISLTVTESGSTDEEPKDGGKYGEQEVIIITVVSFLAVLATVLVVTALVIKFRKENFLRVNQSAQKA